MPQGLGTAFQTVANGQDENRMAGDGGQLPGFADQLESDPVDGAAGAVGIDTDAPPEGLVNGLDLFFKGHHAAALADAHFAHFAAGGDVQFAVLVGDGVKGTQIDQSLRLFRRDQIVLNHQFSHNTAPPYSIFLRFSRSNRAWAWVSASPSRFCFWLTFSGGKIRSTWVAEPVRP